MITEDKRDELRIPDWKQAVMKAYGLLWKFNDAAGARKALMPLLDLDERRLAAMGPDSPVKPEGE